MVKNKDYLAKAPGTAIKEQLNNRGMTQKEFALRIGMTEKHISKLINGEVYLTPEMAVKLEMVLGVPARDWINLEAVYREKLIKVNEEKLMENEIKIVEKIPYARMVELGWIENTVKPAEKVINLRKYFEVVNLALLSNSKINYIAYKEEQEVEKIDYVLLTWAQKAKLEARCKKVKSINLDLLEKSIHKIRHMTTKTPTYFCDELVSVLSKCGIVLVFLPYLKDTAGYQAAFFEQNKIVIALTVEGMDVGMFWYSLFYELGLILFEQVSENSSRNVDLYAWETLIKQQDFDFFVDKYKINVANINEYAEIIDIDPGILVARLQHENYISNNSFNKLRRKY